MRIEHCFGVLKERFNSLKELRIRIRNEESKKFACDWLKVCFILHNALLTDNIDEDYPLNDPRENDEDSNDASSTTDNCQAGAAKRDALMEILLKL